MSKSERIAELRRLLETASPGPWLSYLSSNNGDGYRVTGVVVEDDQLRAVVPSLSTSCPYVKCLNCGIEHSRSEDMELIAEARNALPWLLDQAEALDRVALVAAAAIARILDELNLAKRLE